MRTGSLTRVHRVLLFAFVTLSPVILHAQPCDCPANFAWMVKTFAENDAGYSTVVEKRGKADYERHIQAFRLRADSMKTVQTCQPVLNEWLQYFRHGHIGIWPTNGFQGDASSTEQAPKTVDPGQVDLTEAELRKRLEGKGYKAHPVEGIWRMGEYHLGIVRMGKSSTFKAVVLAWGNANSQPKDVKAELSLNAAGDSLNGTYYATTTLADKVVPGKTPMPVSAFVKGDDQGLLDLFGLWERVYPKRTISELDRIELRWNNGEGPYAMALNDHTMFLRINSFNMDQKPLIDSVLAANDAAIQARPNLIIDIRNGTGGGDAAYAGLMPYLYTTPIRSVDVSLHATPMNADAYEGYVRYFPEDTSTANYLVRVAERMRKNLGTFIPRDEEGRRVQVDSSFTQKPMPQRVAIVCNQRNGSTDEQFLLEAKTSWKVKVFGKPTMGALDVSNLNEVTSPDGLLTMAYAMSRSYRIPDFMIDDHGIQPDHFLDDAIPEDQWIRYVQRVLER